jgi:hypothetical protein
MTLPLVTASLSLGLVDSWASSVESRSTLDFLYVPDA